MEPVEIFNTLYTKIQNFLPDVCDGRSLNMNITYIKNHFPSYQYTGKTDFNDVLRWCQTHLGNNWVWNYETIYFKTEEDKMFFILGQS